MSREIELRMLPAERLASVRTTMPAAWLGTIMGRESRCERYLSSPDQEPDLSRHVTVVYWPAE